MYAIISPAIKLINGNEFDIDYSKYEKYFKTPEIENNIDALTVQDTYKLMLEKQIKNDIEDMGYSIEYVSCNLDIEKGAIKSVKLAAKKFEKGDNIDISINKISIGNNNEKSNLAQDEIECIKQKINSNYGVDYKNITINSI